MKNKEVNLQTKEEKNEQIEKPKRKILKKILISVSILLFLGLSIVLFLLYGPWNGFRDWLITTAMTTYSHQYLATWFYSDETIQDCLNRNKVIQMTGYTDENLIRIIDYSKKKNIKYDNEYERQILEKDDKNNDYKIIEIDDGKDCHGYMAVIYDPSRVELVAASELGNNRLYLTDISEKSNALVAINAGGFEGGYEGRTDMAKYLGVTISDDKIISTSQSADIIGFNKHNKLILGNFSSENAVANNIRDCITFTPYLMMNGKNAEVLGNGGWGKAARSAIGQRADGIVLFLALDGDRIKGKGATMQDLIDIFQKYGAINAANLDGGNSTTMTVHDKVVSVPPVAGTTSEWVRPIPTAFVLRMDDSDDGDYSVVKDKVDK